jgi:parvulin-like peptidyl-prolyl isomerase
MVRAPLLWAGIIMLAAAAAVALNLSRAWSGEPEIVAPVNREPVTRSELERLLADPFTLQQLHQDLGIQEPGRKELERLALRKLIHRHLLLQEAGWRNITVTEQDLDQALVALRRPFKDLRDFGLWMKERGLDDKSLFETIRADMLLKRVMGALVKDVRPTEKEVQDYYEDHKEDLTIGEEVRLRIIVVKSKAAAEEILAALRKGEKFGRLARKQSLGLHAAQGGDMGWVNSQILPLPLQRAVGKLKAGDVGGPLQKSDAEFLIVGLEGRRPVRAKSLAEARSEIERRLLPARQREVLEAWLTGQEKNSKMEIFNGLLE